MPSRVHRKMMPSPVRVKVTPSREGIEKQVQPLQDSSSHSSQDSVNVSSLVDDYLSLDDSVIEDDDISEIIALLERARLRSQNFVENEVVLEQPSKPKEARTKRRPEKYY